MLYWLLLSSTLVITLFTFTSPGCLDSRYRNQFSLSRRCRCQSASADSAEQVLLVHNFLSVIHYSGTYLFVGADELIIFPDIRRDDFPPMCTPLVILPFHVQHGFSRVSNQQCGYRILALNCPIYRLPVGIFHFLGKCL